MKELSTEEKAKAYDEAIEIARKNYDAAQALCNGSQIGIECFKNTLTNCFPELKESEDEKIRKSLLEYLHTLPNHYAHSGVCVPDWIAWLEKQKSVEEIVERYKNSWYNEGKIQGQIEGLSDDEKYQQGWHDALEKQSVQKPVDKVEPKVGDWVVRGKTIAQILDIQEQYYVGLDINGKDFTSSRFLSDDKIHLWTIQDAKDGDVLYCEDGGIEYIVMNKGVNKHSNIDSYFRYNSVNGFGVNIPNVLSSRQDNITPATKEQCDLLFQKMKEAGYEWNVEKKELKKISQRMISAEAKEAMYDKSVWSEDDEKKRNLLITILNVNHPNGRFKVNPINTTNMEVISKDELVSWLKSLENRCTWKPNDEQMKVLLSEVTGWTKGCPKQIVLESLYNDLKKLKE